MNLEIGQIVKNLSAHEPVRITKVQNLSSRISIFYSGINSNKASSKVLTLEEVEKLQVLATEGSYNFKGDPNKFLIISEAERIHSAYQFDPLFAVSCSIVDPLPHQVEAVYKYLLKLPKIRFLLADDTGAGKTIMTGLLIKELMTRDIIERILIITPGGLTKQWQEEEMGGKFNIPFQLVNRAIFSSNPNVFQQEDRIVTSIDFISREDVLNVVGNSHWDLIVFDEAHKLSAYDYGHKIYKSKRYEAAQKLSLQCEHILLLTATPHRGRADTFKKLLQILDEDIFATEALASTRIKELEKEGINKFFIRRLKEDMKDWSGEPLYKKRFTRTVSYRLTDEEKRLYDAVTQYLSKRKSEATETKNIHVSLALMVMQRRLASSIYAIKNTLEKRWRTLQSLLDDVNKNPNLLKQKSKLEDLGVDTLDEFEDLDDSEREALENILSDPRKYKFFTTATGVTQIQEETGEVKQLFEMANSLYTQNQEEMKYQKLKELLISQKVIDGKKLVLFTEHKDTLDYLEERLRSNGYGVETIHGGKSVDERRQAQRNFAGSDSQILIATDAAGEGINLQFCSLLINWDIPWNPNRLEQRMGRIHRYGQKEDVVVFNLVASNTREGNVLEKLLDKLDVIRDGIGDDRVYDVIQDVFEEVSMEDIMKSIFENKKTKFEEFLEEEASVLQNKFLNKIKDQKETLAHSSINYQEARELKEESDEKRLQPIYVRFFFEKAFRILGGEYVEVAPSIFKITKMPDLIANILKNEYKRHTENYKETAFCFDKQLFLDHQNKGYPAGKMHYINPGTALFDSIVSATRKEFREDLLQGTVLVSPDDSKQEFGFLVRSQIQDNRENKKEDFISNEELQLVMVDLDGNFSKTSPAKFLDLHPPLDFAKELEPIAQKSNEEALEWSLHNITLPLLEKTKQHVEKDAARRREYLDTSFTHLITAIQLEIEELQKKILFGDVSAHEKMQPKTERLNELIEKKNKRLENLELMLELTPKTPEILGCAYIVPLSQMEYNSHYGMSRDDEVEEIAMKEAIAYEKSVGWNPVDVSKENQGFDIRSVSADFLKRYIEVKGRSGEDGVMLSENEMNRLEQLGDAAWLYIVVNCKTNPTLYRIQNPAKSLHFEKKIKRRAILSHLRRMEKKSLTLESLQ